MKFQIIDKYSGLPRDFFIYNKTVFYKDKYTICKIDDINSLFIEKDTFVNIIDLKNHLLYYISDSILYQHNLDNYNIVKTLLPKESILQIKIIQKDKYVIRYKQPNNEWKIRCLDYLGNIIWEEENTEPFNSKLVENYFIVSFIRQKKIGLFDFENNLIWQHNYCDLLESDKAFLSNDIIEHKGKIYFFLAGTPNNKTFCVDIETGKIEHTYKDLIMFSFPEGNFLYNLHNNILNILNTKTQKITTIDFLEEFKKHKIHTDQVFAVQNGLIYFTQSMGDIVSKVGILDPKKEKVIWKHKFPKGSGQVGSIKVQGERIYAHTQDKTLHIFEKE